MFYVLMMMMALVVSHTDAAAQLRRQHAEARARLERYMRRRPASAMSRWRHANGTRVQSRARLRYLELISRRQDREPVRYNVSRIAPWDPRQIVKPGQYVPKT